MTRGAPPSKETVAITTTNPTYSTAVNMQTVGSVLAKVTNTTDQTVTANLQGTTFDDASFAAPVNLTSKEIAAGATDVFVCADPYAYLRVKAVAGGVPASGGMVVVWEFRHGRD